MTNNTNQPNQRLERLEIHIGLNGSWWMAEHKTDNGFVKIASRRGSEAIAQAVAEWLKTNHNNSIASLSWFDTPTHI